MILSDEARALFVKQNLGLVHSCAHRFKGRGIEYDDLFGAGSVGIIKAIDAFDESRGLKFSTYAVPVILGEMRRLFRDGGAIKVSRSLKELSLRAMRVREKFLFANSREPTISELAKLLEVSEEMTVEAISAGQAPLSLTVSDDESSNGGQLDIKVDAPEEALADIISLKEVILRLEPRDRKLIILRYFKNKTQTETAKELDMSQVQVSRREKKILATLRNDLSE